jgi:hypothetical protein
MESSASSSAALFPKKPARASQADGKPLKLFSNYFQIDFDSKDIAGVNKYTVKYEPEIPDNAREMRKKVLKLCRDQIKEHLDFYIDWGLCLYSLRKTAELPVFKAEHDGTPYTVTIEWVQIMEKHDKDHLTFMKIFFNSMMRSLKFENIGPKCFNSANAHSLDAHKIKVWPGFDSRLILKENGALLNVDVCFKVVRTDTVLKYLQELRQSADRQKKDPVEYVNSMLAGATVVTRYN